MNMLKIRHFDKDFVIEAGRIYSIDVENKKLYLRMIDAILSSDKEYFVYSENGKLIDFDKKSICITDVFSMDPNNKKILNSLYKRIDSSIAQPSDKEIVGNVNSKILSLLDKISLDLGTKMRYDDDLNLIKLLGFYKFEFDSDKSDLISKLILYIKANMEIMDLKYVLCVNILPLISDDEFDMFQKELELLGLTLININFVNKFIGKNVERVIIDNDLCEIG